MVGLGESEDEVVATLADLRAWACRSSPIGQYLRPSARPPPGRPLLGARGVRRACGGSGAELGLAHVEASPLTRSSYHAREAARGSRAGGRGRGRGLTSSSSDRAPERRPTRAAVEGPGVSRARRRGPPRPAPPRRASRVQSPLPASVVPAAGELPGSALRAACCALATPGRVGRRDRRRAAGRRGEERHQVDVDALADRDRLTHAGGGRGDVGRPARSGMPASAPELTVCPEASACLAAARKACASETEGKRTRTSCTSSAPHRLPPDPLVGGLRRGQRRQRARGRRGFRPAGGERRGVERALRGHAVAGADVGDHHGAERARGLGRRGPAAGRHGEKAAHHQAPRHRPPPAPWTRPPR